MRDLEQEEEVISGDKLIVFAAIAVLFVICFDVGAAVTEWVAGWLQ